MREEPESGVRSQESDAQAPDLGTAWDNLDDALEAAGADFRRESAQIERPNWAAMRRVYEEYCAKRDAAKEQFAARRGEPKGGA